MSKFLAENNSESTLLLFNKRIFYNNLVDNPQNNVEDFIAEKFMYGRVNRRFVPIYVPGDSKFRLKSFNPVIAQERNMRALNFVVDAFEAMARQFDKCASIGQIKTTDPYLSRLKVYKAYQDPKIIYQNHLNQVTQRLKRANKRSKKKIEDFEQFEDLLIRNTKASGLNVPFTFPAFLKSRRCPMNVSGLVIEIADLDASNDHEKAKQFVQSKNWQFFVNAARTYGFMIDKNVPWRLIADIGVSPVVSPMIEYAAVYGADTTDKILFRYFAPSYVNYYSSFQSRLLNIYNTVKTRNIQYTIECGGKTVSKVKKPRDYRDLSTLQSLYSEAYFLELYCSIRMLEEESNIAENDQKLTINDVIKMVDFSNKYKAIAQFERYLNKPFDYQGSLSYYSRRAQAKILE